VKKNALAHDTEITMKLSLKFVRDDDDDDDDDDDRFALNFEFGPLGTQFDPCAELHIPFELLMDDDVEDFVVTCESNGEVEGISYDIDFRKKMLIAYVPHFSIYYFTRR